MQAYDVMTPEVISVHPESSVRQIARLLLHHGVSAVPVIDDNDQLVGMVSEGDLIERPEIGGHRAPWWLGLIDCAELGAAEYVKSHGKQARDVMTDHVITVAPETPVSEIAALLQENQIKRVPVVKDGGVIGIVSRADLLHAIAMAPQDQTAAGDGALRLAILTRLREDVGLPASAINATVSDGVVHLWGGVPSDAEKQAAVVAVWTVHGVQGLIHHVTVQSGSESPKSPRPQEAS